MLFKRKVYAVTDYFYIKTTLENPYSIVTFKIELHDFRVTMLQ